MGVNWPSCGDHLAVYTCIKSCCTPKNNSVIYRSYLNETGRNQGKTRAQWSTGISPGVQKILIPVLSMSSSPTYVIYPIIPPILLCPYYWRRTQGLSRSMGFFRPCQLWFLCFVWDFLSLFPLKHFPLIPLETLSFDTEVLLPTRDAKLRGTNLLLLL